MLLLLQSDRDDLHDGGADHFSKVIHGKLKQNKSKTTIEVLTPDFLRKGNDAYKKVVNANPDVFNHNIETVPAFI